MSEQHTPPPEPALTDPGKKPRGRGTPQRDAIAGKHWDPSIAWARERLWDRNNPERDEAERADLKLKIDYNRF